MSTAQAAQIDPYANCKCQGCAPVVSVPILTAPWNPDFSMCFLTVLDVVKEKKLMDEVSVLHLATANKLIFSFISPWISRNYYFDPTHIYIHYAPLRFNIQFSFEDPIYLGFNITHLLISCNYAHPLPLLPSLTHSTMKASKIFIDHPLPAFPSLSHLTLLVPGYKHPLPPLPSLTHLVIDSQPLCGLYLENFPKLCVLECAGHVSTITNPVSPLVKLSLRGFKGPLPDLPSSLQQLFLGPAYDRDLPSLPLSLTHLSLGKFSQAIPTHLPNLAHLHFENYVSSIAAFPPALTHLSFGDNYDQVIETLPPTLKYLKLGRSYKHTVSLPSGLLELELGFHSNFDIPVLASLTHFAMAQSFVLPLPSLPSLTYLKIGFKYNLILPRFPKLEHLDFSKCENNLDITNINFQILTHLITNNSFNLLLPPTPALRVLILGYLYTQPFQHPLPSLCKLHMKGLKHPLPYLPSLAHLEVSSTNGKLYFKHLPAITRLKFGDYNNDLLVFLPDTIKHLTVSLHYSHPLPRLPASLVKLTLGTNFKRVLPPIDWPPFFKVLKISFGYREVLPPVPQRVTIKRG